MYHNDPSSSLLFTSLSCSSVVPSTMALKLELTRCRPVSFLEASLRALSCFSPAFGVSADDARACILFFSKAPALFSWGLSSSLEPAFV